MAPASPVVEPPAEMVTAPDPSSPVATPEANTTSPLPLVLESGVDMVTEPPTVVPAPLETVSEPPDFPAPPKIVIEPPAPAVPAPPSIETLPASPLDSPICEHYHGIKTNFKN